MNEIVFDTIRWLDEPARIRIMPSEEGIETYLQIIAPREISALCLGRPVEEVPRILTILSPAHHLASARALDRLFGVEPPPAAANMREALLYTMFFLNHLRKFYSLLSFWLNPTLAHVAPEGLTGRLQTSPYILDDIMHAVSVAGEAAAILGGRNDHPVSSLPGGVGRLLKEEYLDRLSTIAESCLTFTVRLGDLLRKEVLVKDGALSEFEGLSVGPICHMVLDEGDSSIVLRDESGKEQDRFLPGMIFQKIGFQMEPWTYEPFAYLTGRSGGPEQKAHVGNRSIPLSQCFFVGPLGRLKAERPLTPLAEAERQRVLETLVPLTQVGILPAFWSLFVELLLAAEKMAGLFNHESLSGSEIRTMPSEMGSDAEAAVESPKGLIYHHYKVDEKGLVQEIQILDTVTENNALRCLLIQKTAEIAVRMKKQPPEMKGLMELALLPFS